MSIIDMHIVGDGDCIVCEICGMKLLKIDGRHTKKIHKITFEEYKKKYPFSPTITKNKLEKELNNIEKVKKAKQLVNKKTKIITCCNFECDNTFEVNINVSNTYTLCNECKSKGIKNEKAIENYKKTSIAIKEKYGVDNISQLQSVQETKRKNLEEKVKEDPNYFNEIVEKRKDTIKDIYGDNWKTILNEKSKKGMLEIHGVEHALQKQEFKDKFKNTCLSEFGYETPFHSPDIQEEIKNSVMKTYGVDHIMKVKDISEKTSIGVKKSWEDPIVRKKREEAHLSTFLPRLQKFLRETANLDLMDEYQHAHYSHRWKCLKCNNEFITNWNSIQCGYTCPNCRPRQTKKDKYKAQKELCDFIESLGFEISVDNRSLIKPYELDIVIHSEKIAFEYCGFFWHNEKILGDTRKKINDITKYHLYKLQWCKENNYRLITIFEDEWIFKKEITMARIKHILNKNKANRIHARKCEIFELTPQAKNEFLSKYHIQGKDNATINLGAFYNEELIAVMTFSKGNISKGSIPKDLVWELNRFCLSFVYYSPGIASKLLNYFKCNYEWKEIFSYADRRWSEGELYYKIGFSLDKISPPNYWYLDLNKLKRIHRFALRKREDESKDISEKILRISEGYKIIWDCGNLKFSMKNN